MINFRNTVFIKSAPDYKDAPEKTLGEILFVGRSNVGKSSLINALCDHSSLAFTSSKPGYTKLLNFFSVDQKFYLVDAPGYGYSKLNGAHYLFFGDLMENYFKTTKTLKGVVFLLDSRRELNEDDIDIYQYLLQNDIPTIIVMTKSDKINQKEKAFITRHLNESILGDEKPIFVSSKNKKGIENLKTAIEKLI